MGYMLYLANNSSCELIYIPKKFKDEVRLELTCWSELEQEPHRRPR